MEIIQMTKTTILVTCIAYFIFLGLTLSVPVFNGGVLDLCHKCHPGYVDANKCQESGRPTKCTLCKNGKFSSDLDYSTECFDCTTVFGCDPSQTLLRNCTAEHDSLCGCKNHETLKPNGICRKNYEDFYPSNGIWCRRCPPGSRVKEDCTEDGSNSTCSSCSMLPSRTFNLMWTSSKECKHCSICDISFKLKILTKCTPTADTVCTCIDGYIQRESITGMDCSPGNGTKIKLDPKLEDWVNKTKNTKNIPEISENTDVTVIYTPVVCVVIILAVIALGFVVYSCKKKGLISYGKVSQGNGISRPT